jgi:thymidylate synthase (FAD)
MTINWINHSTVELIDSNASDDMVAKAAWVSFDADKEERLADIEGVGKLINFLWKNRHTSPFEHGIFTFKVKTPIFVAREFHRHRAASYNEMSGRYVEMTGEFYIPPRERPLVQKGKPGHYRFVEGSNEQYALMRTHMEAVCNKAWKSYNDMLDFGIAKEVARDILPLNTVTQFYASMNPRNLMHFLGLRAEENALWEIREVAHGNADLAVNLDEIANGMERHLAELMPLTYEAFERNK